MRTFLSALTLILTTCLTGCRGKSPPQPEPEKPKGVIIVPDNVVGHVKPETTKRLKVHPLNWAARWADTLMIPAMYLVAGTLKESPQQTHFWNNAKLQPQEVAHLQRDRMTHCKGIPDASPPRVAWIPLLHLPIFGGWRNYAVLEPVEYNGQWHVGWQAGGAAGVSRIPVRGPVRMLVGPGDVSFFGVTAGQAGGDQVRIRQIGSGRIGKGGPYAKVPLL
jgi:hypothetical protein